MENTVTIEELQERLADLEIKVSNQEETDETDFTESYSAILNYLERLPITRKQNDRLAKLIIKSIGVAEKGSFLAGFEMGVKITREFAREH